MAPGSKTTDAPTSCSLVSLSYIYPEIVDAKVEVANKGNNKRVEICFISPDFGQRNHGDFEEILNF
jgi:hypothetical protein